MEEEASLSAGEEEPVEEQSPGDLAEDENKNEEETMNEIEKEIEIEVEKEKEPEQEKEMETEKEKDEDKDKENEKENENESESESEEDVQLKEQKKMKNKKKKNKKKRAKERKRAEQRLRSVDGEGIDLTGNEEDEKDEGVDDVEIDYVAEGPDSADPLFQYFSKVFDAFKISEADLDKVKKEPADASRDGDDSTSEMPKAAPKAAIVERIIQEEEEAKREKAKEEAEKPKMSKRKSRIMMRPTIADLKAGTNRPDVVEWHDVTAKDPKLLVHLKSIRNTVPVPRHWCFKRKYLAGKRGFEKAPFDLPDFIKRTGIMEMRQALQEKEDQKTTKTKMREKIRPKMGKIDIDYQKLHDAFFRWQTKPRMSIVGDLYYEGKELETKMRDKKPGELSDDLRIALGMPVGPNAQRFPPPWLIAMQRYGPPPSYPNLKVPGLNAPIPDGCSFGYHAGGWGKPPVDETGRPLYGDVFGTDVPAQPSMQDDDEIERRPWGELESEESSSEEEEEEEQAGEAEDETGLVTPAEGLITPSGISSGIPAGVETPDSIELRKRKMQEEGGDTPAQLYTVLPERRIDRFGGQMMGSTHVYDLTTTTAAAAASEKKKAAANYEGGVEVTLNPDELDTLSDMSGLQQKYQEVKQQQQQATNDFSDLVVEHAAKQTRKRKAQETKKAQQTGSGTASSSKKHKEFKF